jgi:hypothetical protein
MLVILQQANNFDGTCDIPSNMAVRYRDAHTLNGAPHNPIHRCDTVSGQEGAESEVVVDAV